MGTILNLRQLTEPFRPVRNTLERIFDRLLTPFGERIHSDEMRHRLVIECGGVRRFIGWEGGGAGEFMFPRGLAFLPATIRGDSRLFVCDSWNHRIQVFNGDGDFVMAFGGRGSRPGQLLVPSGVAIVHPQFPDDPPGEIEPLLAVSERGNHRVQVFTMDGAPLATIGRFGLALRGNRRWHWGDGDIVFNLPTRLRWIDPDLEVQCAYGRIVRLELALAMRVASGPFQLPAECA
jgi:hypothetical protein